MVSIETFEWPQPIARFLNPSRPPPPILPLDDILQPDLARWIRQAADAKGAPVDYVFGSLLAIAGTAIGNTRWVAPWSGWAEPPIIWSVCIGLPSMNKSPGIDATLIPYRKAAEPLRAEALKEREAWDEKADVAKIAGAIWKDQVKAALAEGKPAPPKPEEADAGDRPHIPRHVVNDGTIEKLGAIVAVQPRGTLQMRDELAGWLEGMNRYSGGSDRPFWLEAYGGRPFTVERMGRDPLTVERLSIGVLGGIQPDRLRSLLLRSDDDGLLARFVPFWPNPAPIRRPDTWADETLIDAILLRLLSLDFTPDDEGPRPWFVPFDDSARDLMDELRRACREWEQDVGGLILSFTGKMPGLAARLSLILAHLDWAAGNGDPPQSIGVEHFGRAAHFVEAYALPMARRAYADASQPADEKAAVRIIDLIRENRWREFSSREVLRAQRTGIDRASFVEPALRLLEDADCISQQSVKVGPNGGRPAKTFLVNPFILEARP